MIQLGLTDKIFGPANEVYVTRNQISDLTTEIYQKLNIIEDYQMAQSEFSDNFLDYFISQTASQIFSNVNLKDALNSLSQYDFKTDLQPNIITQELSKIFTINSTKSRELIVLNDTFFEQLKQNSHIATSGSADGDFVDIFSASVSANYVNDKSSDWAKANTSFDNQLNELNKFSSNSIEWQRSGDIIVPKSIQLVKLQKSLMQKNMVFTRVKREYYDAPFQRSMSLSTLGSTDLPSSYVENAQKLLNLERQAETLTNTVLVVNQATQLLEKKAQILDNLIYLVNQSLISVSSKLNETSDSLNSYTSTNNQKTQDLDSRVSNFATYVQSNLNSLHNSLDNFEKMHIEKGLWTINVNALNRQVYEMSANFNVNYRSPPQVFYTKKTNEAPNWSFSNENIGLSSISVSIQTYFTYQNPADIHKNSIYHEFQVEWVAIGVI